MRLYVVGAILIVVLVSGWNSRAQELTIPERVEKMGPGPYIAPGRIRELYPMPFDRVVRDADLIVQASLRKVRTYLSDDQIVLYTDHEIVPVSVIASRVPLVSPKPGAPEPLILREWGGETSINGVFVRIYEENVPFLPTGSPLLLFLSLNTRVGKYEVVGTIAGVYEIDAQGKVKHLLTTREPAYERFNSMALDEVVREILQHRR